MAAVARLPALVSDPRARDLKPVDVAKLLDAGKSPRVRELEGLQSFFEGTQYAGRKHFYDDDVPLQEREPIVKFKLAYIAIESNVAFAMGENRFPVVLSQSAENDQVFDKALGLSTDESANLDQFNAKLVDLARLEQVFRQGYRMAQASRSAAFVLGFRSGLPFADLVWAKHCTPSFSDPNDPYKCTQLVIRYRYTDTWRDPLLTQGKWWTRVFEYCRVIDATNDTVYQPAAIWDEADAGVVIGQSAVQTTTAHGFGLCPVHWYARNRASIVGTTPDGKAIHDGLCGLLEQIDMALSQRHRAAIYTGDPTTVISGSDASEAIGAEGRAIRPPILPGDASGQGAQWQQAFSGGQKPAQKKLRRGASQVWRIPDPQGKATMLVLPGDALKALDDDAKDLVQRACDDMGITSLDPEMFKGGGDLSGRTLSFMFSKQVNRVSQDREDVGRCCILPVLNLFYRMLLANTKGVYLPGLAKVIPILKRFQVAVAGQTAPIWFAPQLKLKWGDFFEPSDVDESTRVATAINALTSSPPLIQVKTAVEHIRGVFGIASVDQYVTDLQKEAAQRQQDALANAQAMAATAPQPPTGAASKPPMKKGGPSAQKSPNAAPPASGTPKASRRTT